MITRLTVRRLASPQQPLAIAAREGAPVTKRYSEIKLPSAAELSALGGINATMRIILDTQTPEKGSLWAASCEWNGHTFEAPSRSGASHALCRLLVAAGCPDQALQVFDENGRHQFTHRAIHAAAQLMLSERDHPLRRRRWTQNPHGADAAKQGGAISPSEVGEQGSGELRAYASSRQGHGAARAHSDG